LLSKRQEKISMSDMGQWYAIRCCCEPERILGFLKVAADTQTQLVQDRNGEQHPIKLARLRDGRTPLAPHEAAARGEVAIHSDHRPIEFWRTIRGFIEAPDLETAG
jgi:hypothetical protein